MGRVKRYFSVDVEAAGPVAGIHSLFSLGSCAIWRPGEVFYREFRPISMAFVFEAVRIASKGLHLLNGHKGELDPASPEFSPMAVLRHMDLTASDPLMAMNEFWLWLRQVGGPDCEPVFVSDTMFFDASHVNCYFHRFCSRNPFGHTGIHMNGYLKGQTGDMNASIKNVDVPGIARGVEHNALDDAVYMAHQCRMVAPAMAA
jgi:hypothetical protein